MSCELCETQNQPAIWRSQECRIVDVNDPNYPGYCRVIWNQHVREMTDLIAHQRELLMGIVFAVESAIRESFKPDKVNLASLGNITPHLHWHIIPRFREDKHFPNPIWGEPMRHSTMAYQQSSDNFYAALQAALARYAG